VKPTSATGPNPAVQRTEASRFRLKQIERQRRLAPVADLCVRRQQDCNIMKRLFSSPDSAEIGLIRSRLEAAGIECEMRNEHLSSAMPGTPFDPELWVLRDSQFAEARELLAAWCQRASPSGPETP
jgi:hypothetical protein